ncbi:MAG: aminoacyl-tRNA hydrolase [Oscillospiraceae bacterium]|jgi:PTH1 family peptidyl-tRNA hydrolase|nr:aminoacyl-tRNA hydrolase [Oscillospiraceae bacterium]
MFFKRNISPVSWIAVFLGNPGLRYENTRHNAGFITADIIAKELVVKINRVKFSALTSVIKLGGQQVLMLKPQTYMNLSGNSVKQAMRYYKLPLENVVVISDDVSLPAGKLRIRRRGSAGGHNGLRDIIAKCGGEDFTRIRIGVGAPTHDEYDMADWVLSKLSNDDRKLISETALKAAAALEMIIMQGTEKAMSEFN